jgi:hypothetical protein
LIYTFTNDGKVTREQMAAFVERADKTKLRRAAELLSKVSANGTSALLEPSSERKGH